MKAAFWHIGGVRISSFQFPLFLINSAQTAPFESSPATPNSSLFTKNYLGRIVRLGKSITKVTLMELKRKGEMKLAPPPNLYSRYDTLLKDGLQV